MTGAPHLYSIPAGVSFVDALASSLLERHGDDRAALARHLILLPNRRSARSLREAFLRASGGRALLLPRMGAIGDLDDLPLFGLDDKAALDLPPAIDDTERLFLLTRLILAVEDRTRLAHSPAAALMLARELGHFIDAAHTEGLALSALGSLAPDDLADHWRQTLTFLDIIIHHWPVILEERGLIDAADRRNRLIAALAARWRETPPDHPVIAAGTTGSIPATANLLGVIARLPQGAVILPGFDAEHDSARDGALDPVHPQYLMTELLDRLGARREEVANWPLTAADQEDARQRAPRVALLKAALAPAAGFRGSTDALPRPEAALKGLQRIDCAASREEAVAIALLLREALEKPGRRAALVTPDRALARQVRAELGRYGIQIDDSAGQPLANSEPGGFLRLILQAAADGFGPVALLALLRHPLAAAGLPPPELRRLMRRLDAHQSRDGGALRGPRPEAGLDALVAAARTSGAAKEDCDAFADVLDRLRPLEILMAAAEIRFEDGLQTLISVAEALAASADRTGAERLWRQEAGERLADLLMAAQQAAANLPPVGGADLPALFDGLLSDAVVRPRFGQHPRLQILGAIEARLQHADLMILGGLNEGVWPAAPSHDPWMSRAMRADFGLPPVERRIGQAAHDFYQAASAREVVMTRAGKVDGAPTLQSRWLSRLAALTPLPGGPARRILRLAGHLDRPEQMLASTPPRPTPPLAARPSKLSVTEVETLMRDPYALYARKILGLNPLDPLDEEPGAAARGSVMHDALDLYARRLTSGLDAAARQTLILACGREAFGANLARPAIWAFWWPRFERVAMRFLEIEADRHGLLETLKTEIRGEIIPDGLPGFTLVAKADRIDRRLDDGALVIIDYKTGAPPSPRQISAGYAPQMPLEGYMAEEGAFPGMESRRITGLEFWQLRGTREPIEIKAIKDHEAQIKAARAGLLRLIGRFSDAGTPYLSNPRPAYAGYGEYDHLARVAEWTALPGGLEDER